MRLAPEFSEPVESRAGIYLFCAGEQLDLVELLAREAAARRVDPQVQQDAPVLLRVVAERDVEQVFCITEKVLSEPLVPGTTMESG